MMLASPGIYRSVLACALALFAGAGVAAQDAASTVPRTSEQIRAERAAADADYVRKVKECGEHFVVTSCVDAARAERHAIHLMLDREQQQLDDARRQQRAAERQQAIDARTSDAAVRAREAAARSRSESRAASEAARAVPAPASAAQRSAKPVPDAAQRAAQEARARQAFELKQLQAEAHRREVEERNAERARKTNPGAPLPVPPASAASTAAPAR